MRPVPCRRTRPLLFVLATAFTACAAPGAHDDVADGAPAAVPAPGVAGAWPLVAAPDREPAAVAPGQAPPPGPYLPGVDVLHYDIELALSDTARWIAGRARLRVLLRAPVPELRLDLSGLEVRAIEVEGRAAAFRQEDGRIWIPLSHADDDGVGDTLDVVVVYGGVPDDGLVLQENIHGAPAAFADNWPDRARFWFPSVDHPSDKATVGFTVHAPARWTVVANGVLVEPPSPSPTAVAPTGAGGRTWRWSQDVPIPTYTMVVGAAVLVRGAPERAACGAAPAAPAASEGCIEVDWYAFPEDSAAAARVFARSARMVDVFTREIAPFPYARLSNVQSSTRFGGMENVTAIFYPEESVSRETLGEGTVAHEIAHQWFGDGVTESDWHHLWLSEGFATYWSALFFLWEDGEEEFREQMEAHLRRYLDSGASARPVVDPAENDLFGLLNRNNYQKGAWVLHMLRGLLGDDTFNRGIRAYYERHRDSTALTDDLRVALEEASGRDLAWFFDQWIFRPGHPRLRMSWRWDGDAGEAVVRIRQVQPEAWPVFRLPTEVEVRGGGTAAHRVPVEILHRDEEFRIPLQEAPDDVVLDPDGWILREDAG